MTLRVTAGGVTVTVQGDAVDETTRAMERLAYDGVPAALMSRTASLWGPEAAGRAAGRLGWVDLPETSRRLLPELAEAVAALPGSPRVVLAGAGGPVAAAGVIARAQGLDLTVLDTVDPHRVRQVIGTGLDRTVLVVAGKNGTTAEADALRRVFDDAFRRAGTDPARRIVVVTDPGSPLEASAKDSGQRVILSDPDTGGWYAALTASALVPAALCGADAGRLLDEAAALSPALRLPYDNPGLALGAALGGAAAGGRGTLVIVGDDPARPGLARWVEGLVAASTGKDGKGLLPVVVEDATAPGAEFADGVRRVMLGAQPGDVGLAVSGPLGAQFLLWEYATAVAARLIGVDPFDDPGVREAADATAVLMRGADGGEAPTLVTGEPVLVDGDIEVHGPADPLEGAGDLTAALDALAGAVPGEGYLAVTAYLDPVADAAVAELRPLLARRTSGAPVTFGWGPACLHSTGEYHRGGARPGAFLQITGEAGDVPVPGRPYGLAALQLAQAFADLRALRARGRPVVRLHLRDRVTGPVRLRAALGG